MSEERIHVLQIIGEFTSGGAESVVVNLANGLNSTSIQFTFTARRDGPVSKGLPNSSNLVIIPKKKGFDLKHLVSLIKLIRKLNVNIVHSHLFGPNLFGFFASKLTGRKIIQTIHGRDCLATRKRVWAYRLMAPHVDQIVTVSESLEDEFRKKVKRDGLRIKTIHNGIPVNRFSRPVDKERKLSSLGLSTTRKIIGAVGNVKLIKGYDILLKAIAILKQREVPDFVLVIVGEVFPNQEPYKKKLDHFVEKNNLREQVLFLGYREDISEILYLFDLYVLASRSEGLSISLLEAMAASKPVVVTNVGMNSQIIENEFNGIIIPPEDPESLANAIMKILKDVDFAKKLASNALKTVRDRYNDHKMVNEYISLYKKISSGLTREKIKKSSGSFKILI